jgi:Asp-tRNA(Asn)/Glu-tRNA(Gln) amidotransferase A subunit family amidase
VRAALPWAIAVLAALRPGAHPLPPAQPANPGGVFEASIDELGRRLAAGDVTSRDLVRQSLARIAAYDQAGPALNAMVSINPRALDEADARDRERRAGRSRGPLHGLPFVVKDNFDTVDLPTTGSSVALATHKPRQDATLVARLRAAGAVIVGKTNLHELAAGIVTVSSLGGRTRNPYGLSRNPGGSSGGTGAAVAASFGVAGLGTDTCGSIRIPAAHNNLVGLRPTMGLTSRAGIIPLAHTQDVGGPVGRSVRDVALVLDAIAGPDDRDPATRAGLGRAPASYAESLGGAVLPGARLGVLRALFGTDEDREVADLVDGAVARMREAGAVVVDVSVPDLAGLLRSSAVIDYEFKFDLADYLAAQPAPPVRSLGEILERGLYHADLDAPFRRRNATASADSAAYRAALGRREDLTRLAGAAMDMLELDALIYPPIRRKAAPLLETQGGGNNCQLSASTGWPALVVPAGFTADGLPVGIEFLGRPFSEPRLLSLGSALEARQPLRRPPSSTPRLEGRSASTSRLPRQASGPGSARAAVLRVDVTWQAATRTLGYRAEVQGVPASEVLVVTLDRAGEGGPAAAIARLLAPGQSRGEGRIVLRPAEAQDLEAGRLTARLYTRGRPLDAVSVPVVIGPGQAPRSRRQAGAS